MGTSPESLQKRVECLRGDYRNSLSHTSYGLPYDLGIAISITEGQAVGGQGYKGGLEYTIGIARYPALTNIIDSQQMQGVIDRCGTVSQQQIVSDIRTLRELYQTSFNSSEET
jgi:hypothetical protein